MTGRKDDCELPSEVRTELLTKRECPRQPLPPVPLSRRRTFVAKRHTSARKATRNSFIGLARDILVFAVGLIIILAGVIGLCALLPRQMSPQTRQVIETVAQQTAAAQAAASPSQ